MYSAGRRRTIIVLFLTSLILITLDTRGNAAFDAARSGFALVLRPFNAAGEVIARPIDRVWTGIADADDLRRENEALHQQLDGSSADLIAAENAIIQANELKDKVDLEVLRDIPKVTGDIIGASPSNFDQQVELGVGTKKGVRVGMPVISGGLVGKVTHADAESCVVRLITDPQYTVRVKIVGSQASATETSAPEPTTPSGIPQNSLADIVNDSTIPTSTVVPVGTGIPGSLPGTTTTSTTTTTTTTTVPGAGNQESTTTTTTTEPQLQLRETGALNGKGADRLPAVSFVYETQQLGLIKKGDAVLTTGGRASLAPPDIPVGRVANVINEGGVDGIQVEVEVSADLDQLNFLTVLLYKPPSELGAVG